MKILGIETSTMLGGVAIVDSESGFISETRLNVKSTHSERLMTAIDSTLQQSDLCIDDIDAFAVAIGPGSFTGLRIGLSSVKGLSYATGRPFVSVPTLEAFAWNFPFCSHPVCLMLDARKGEVYTAVFDWNGAGFTRRIAEVSVTVESLVSSLEGTVLFAGEGALLYRDRITAVMQERAVFADTARMIPSPANVALLGLKRVAAQDFSGPSTVPWYIRKSEAEVKRAKKGE